MFALGPAFWPFSRLASTLGSAFGRRHPLPAELVADRFEYVPARFKLAECNTFRQPVDFSHAARRTRPFDERDEFPVAPDRIRGHSNHLCDCLYIQSKCRQSFDEATRPLIWNPRRTALFLTLTADQRRLSVDDRLTAHDWRSLEPPGSYFFGAVLALGFFEATDLEPSLRCCFNSSRALSRLATYLRSWRSSSRSWPAYFPCFSAFSLP